VQKEVGRVVVTKAVVRTTKVKDTNTKEIKVQDTKETKEQGTKETKAASDKEAKEAKEQDTKETKEQDTKDTRGHGPAETTGNSEMSDNNSSNNVGVKAVKVDVAMVEAATGSTGTGGRTAIEGQRPRTWKLTLRSAHATIVPMTKGGLGAIRHGKRRRSNQDETTESMKSRME